MADIYSQQWYESLKQILNGSAQVTKNAPRGVWHVLAEIKGDTRPPPPRPGPRGSPARTPRGPGGGARGGPPPAAWGRGSPPIRGGPAGAALPGFWISPLVSRG